MNILLIEDNEQNAYLVTFLLRSAGMRVMHAMDGPSGIDMASREDIDLILLDIQLPGMSGYTVATRLRQIERARLVPIIAVTSHAMVGDRELAHEAGCDGFIEKPIDPDTFVSRIDYFMNRKAEDTAP